MIWGQIGARKLTNDKKSHVLSWLFVKSGRNGGIRTHDPYHPKVVHYQAVLRPGERYYTQVFTLCYLKVAGLLCGGP
jgi:hypothetical protein